MMKKFLEIFERLKLHKELVFREREPTACILCSTKEALEKYHAAYPESNKFVIEDPSEIEGLIIMEDLNELILKCPKKGCERVKPKYNYTVPVGWLVPPCLKCQMGGLTVVEGKCRYCDPDSKKAMQDLCKKLKGE